MQPQQVRTGQPAPHSAHPFDLEERLLQYAAAVLRLCDEFNNRRGANYVASQLIRSGTSPLANHAEAQSAQSTRDLIHKLSISLKELRETKRWLRLAVLVPLLKSATNAQALLEETEELIRIFFTSIRTAQKRPARHSLNVQCSMLNVDCSSLSENEKAPPA